MPMAANGVDAALPQPNAGLLPPAPPLFGDYDQPLAGRFFVLPANQLELDSHFITPQFPSADTKPANENAAATPVAIDQSHTPVMTRPPIVFRPAVPTFDSQGLPILRPSVWFADPFATEIQATPGNADNIPGLPSNLMDPDHSARIEELDLQSILADSETSEGVWDSANVYQQSGGYWRNFLSFIHPKKMLPGGYDIGVGRERLPFALSEIDSSQPLNNMRLRFDSAYNLPTPDRAEVFWSKPGRGPSPLPAETSVDYQDIRFLTEIASQRFSASTEIPLRFLNPTVFPNNGGLGDIIVATKTVLVDGKALQLTQIMKIQMNTGAPKSGRGSGHMAMEPGLIARYKWRPDTYLHGELKFMFPLGGSPDFSGEVLRYGLGIAHVYYETDTFAVIPTLEFVSWSVLTGKKTVSGTTGPVAVNVDGENILNVYPGVRLVHDGAGDFGMFEVGLSSGLSVTKEHWYNELLRLDLRWSY
jgi:hypothetical protein